MGGIFMNREQILEKAKKENYLGDEREREISLKSNAFSLLGFIIVGVMIIAVRFSRGESVADIEALLLCTVGSGYLYNGIKLKQKLYIFSGSVFLLAAMYYFYAFYMRGI